MSTITTRSGKGSPLTNSEVDTNFTNLNTDKLENITGESIKNLSDVNSSMSPSAGDALIYDAANGWQSGTGANTAAVTVANSKFVVDGTSQQALTLSPSITYRFDQSDSSNANHPLKFSATADGTHNSGSAFTTGVTVSGTAGSTGAYVEIKMEQDAPTPLYYYCGNHSGMGGVVSSGGAAVTVQDEGSALATAVETLNFTGAGVTASGTGAAKTINIPGATVTTNGSLDPVKQTEFTATANQTAFTVAYGVGNISVYHNGSKLAAADFTATSGTSVVLATGAAANDLVVVEEYGIPFASPYSASIYTASAGQTTLSVNYTVAKVAVSVNGVKLYVGTDVTATNGTSLTFTNALSAGDKIEVVEHGAYVETATTFTGLTDTPSTLGTAGQVVQVNSAGNALEFAAAAASGGGVNNQGTLTKTFIQDEIASITLSNAVSPVPVLSVFKEVSQIGLSSKGSWDVNSTASNYTRHDEAYASTALTPSSSTTDGTFTTSNPVATVSYDIASGAFMNKSHDHSAEENNARGLAFKPDGTKMYLVGTGDNRVRQYSLSTAWDVSTASYDSKDFLVSSQTTTPDSLTFSATGDKMYVCGYGAATLFEYDLSTDWDVSSASYNNNSKSIAGISGQGMPRGIAWKPDGSSFVVLGTSAYWLETFNLSSNWDLSSTLTVGTYVSLGAGALGGVYGGTGVEWNSDGTKVYVACYSKDKIFEYSIASGYEYTANPASGAFVKTSNEFSLAPTVGNVGGIAMGDSGTKFYTVDSSTDTVRQYSMGGDQVFNTADLGKTIEGNDGVALVTGTYGAYELKTPFTNTNQLTSGNWALYGTQAKTDGSGIDISVSHAGHKVSSMSLTYSKFDITSYGSQARALRISPDGTKLYHCDNGSNEVYQFTLSTPFDLSTATTSGYQNYWISGAYDMMWNGDGSRVYFLHISNGWVEKIPSTNYSLAGSITSGGSNINDHSTQSSTAWVSGVMSSDGTKLYMLQGSSRTVYQYSLTTPYTLADGYTFDSKSVTLRQDKNAINLNISNDGTKLFYQQYIDGPKIITRFFGTPWDVSTATSTGEAEYEPTGTGFAIPGNDSMYVTFDPTGTIMYLRSQSEEKVYQYSTGESLMPDGVYHISVTSSLGQIDSSTWTDINSMTADDTVGSGSVYYAVSNDDRTTWSVNKGTDGVRKIAKNNSGTWQYNSNATYGSETWTNSTTNNELAALQQALSVAQNRMNKAQLDAIPDANHFPTGDTFDLMIGLYIATNGGLIMPKSDGVTINYDAAAKIQQAVNGTDYEADFPTSTKVRIKSLAAQNLKVRVI